MFNKNPNIISVPKLEYNKRKTVNVPMENWLKKGKSGWGG